MLLRRFMLWLVAATVAGVSARTACAQHWTPFGPSDIRYDLELFAPPELSTYGNGPGPRANTGMFFSYERLNWWFNRPAAAVIGSKTAAPAQSNTFISEIFQIGRAHV